MEQINLIPSLINGSLRTTLVAIIYFCILFIPGYLYVILLGLKRHRFLLSYGLSLLVLVISLSLALLIEMQIRTVVWLYLCLAIVIPITPTLIRARRKHDSFNRYFTEHPNRWHLTIFTSVPLIITIGFVLYHSLVGPYTEVPSDFWKHLARTVHQFLSLDEGIIQVKPLVGLLWEGGAQYWYLTQATIARLLGVHPLTTVYGVTLITGLSLLLSTYIFTIRVCEPLEITDKQKIIAGVLATLFTLVTFGTATFSYIRYYALSPAIIAFPLIYLATTFLLDYLERSEERWPTLLIIPFVVMLAGAIHLQEALFCVLLIVGILATRIIRVTIKSYRTEVDREILYRSYRVGAVLFVIITGAAITIYSFTENINPWQNTPHIIDAGKILNVLGGYPIANPSFRFWDTIGLFGVFIYLWYLYRQKWLRQIDYLTAGMAIPVFTFFNPVYSNFFLRLAEAPVLWRPAYLIPLSIVAGILVVLTDQNSIGRSFGRRVAQLTLILVIFLASLLPFDNSLFINRTSRMPSLTAVDMQSGLAHWEDLIRKVEKLQHKYKLRKIISDPITTFILTAATRGQAIPFISGRYFPGENREYRNDLSYSDHTNSLLIINRRDGYDTMSARESGHWANNVLNISQLYPNDIDEYIEANNGISLLWSNDSISVYLIRYWHFYLNPSPSK